MYTLPSGANQSTYGQTFYGSMTKNIPTQGDALFSPGVPLYPVKGINPAGLPVQWRFPPQYNSFPASDRSLGNADIPSFEQLRSLARLFYGIGLCERVWLDLVPRMQLQVKLTKAAVAGGAETKNYQDEITFFQRFFEKPDGKRDYHTWLRMALREQTQIDELYIYKNRKRNGELLGLSLVAGDQMKPLLDQWGHIPDPPEYAYQQYPWGIPGALYSTDMMVHYQESPATDNPYGLSRVERIILIVNLALKKMRKDLAHYASGNVPAGIMEVPEGLNWTPDQIDAYEQMWNSLLAGNAAKQVQVKFTQPGMKYTKLDDFSPDTPFDEFLLNVSVAAYGLSMQDLAFTEDIHKSSGDSQQNSTYRRTIDPLASVYAMILTESMHEDFEPSLHGDLFEVGFGGFEEKEDLGAKIAAYSQAADAGFIGRTDASKALDMPEPPDAPYIGRMLITKDGPVFLDDIATPEARKVAADAKLAGLQLAANPTQQQGEGDGEDTTPKKVAQGGPGKQQPPGKTSSSQAGRDSSRNDDSGGSNGDQSRAVAPGLARDGAEQPISPDDRASSIWKRGTCDCDECRMNDGQVRSGGEAFPSGAVKPGGHEGCDCKVKLYSEELARADNARPAMLQRHTGMMVAFLLDPENAQQLAIPDGEPSQDLHVTLVFLGDMEDEAQPGKLHPATSLENIKTILSAFAGNASPLQGKLGGIARFINPDAEVTPVTVPINAPGLQEWRRRLVSVLESAGYGVANDFDFLPHITLAYIPADAPMPIEDIPDLALKFDTLCLAIGDDRFFFPIGAQNEELARADIKRWRQRALDDIKASRAFRSFRSESIPASERSAIEQGLAATTTADEVRAVFERAKTKPGQSELATSITGLFADIEARGRKALTT